MSVLTSFKTFTLRHFKRFLSPEIGLCSPLLSEIKDMIPKYAEEHYPGQELTTDLKTKITIELLNKAKHF